MYPGIQSSKGRTFACYPVALQAVIVNPQQQALLLSSPTRNTDGAWQVISGGLEAQEAVLDGVLREVREEAGDIQVRPLGVYHVNTFSYDDAIPFMIGIYYLLAYTGGQVQPGDDMRGSRFAWFGLRELADPTMRLHIPPDQKWVLRRAIQLYQAWRDDPDQEIDLRL